MDICFDRWRAPIHEAGCRILLARIAFFFSPRDNRRARAGNYIDFTSTLLYLLQRRRRESGLDSRTT
jgi:hypothetical protein